MKVSIKTYEFGGDKERVENLEVFSRQGTRISISAKRDRSEDIGRSVMFSVDALELLRAVEACMMRSIGEGGRI